MDIALIASLVGNVAFASGAAIAALKLASERIRTAEYEDATGILTDKLSDLRGANTRLDHENARLKRELAPLREAEDARQAQRRLALAKAHARNAERNAAKAANGAAKPVKRTKSDRGAARPVAR